MFANGLATSDILKSVGIAVLFIVLAIIANLVLRKVLAYVVKKTPLALDNFLVKAFNWPFTVLLVLVGLYLAIVALPIETSFDAEIRKALHVVFIVLGAAGIGLILDSLYRWFKAEVTPKTNTIIDDWFIILMRIVTPLLLLFTAAVLSLKLYGINTSAIESWMSTHGNRIGFIVFFTVLVLIIIGVVGSKAVTRIVARGTQEQTKEEIKKRADTLSNVLITSLQVFVLVIALFIVLSELNINIAPILASAGVAGVAIGFGAQSLVKDIIAGFFIVMENQYRIGDVVNIAGIGGLVEEVNLRRTVLRDLDGIVHIVPNGEIKVASNYTKEWSRVNMNIAISYGADIETATRIINKVCKDMAEEPRWAPLIIKAPQVLRVDKLGDSGVELKVLGDTKPIYQWDIMGELRKRIKLAFDKEGIEIPWPHTKVYFGNSPSDVARK